MPNEPTIDLRTFLKLYDEPLLALDETPTSWRLHNFTLSKAHPVFSSGYSHELTEQSHLYKHWFELSAPERRGWALIFRAFAPREDAKQPAEYFVGWVPPEREAEADRWVELLNGEIRKRLLERSA